MKVSSVLCMKGGNGDTSYAANSILQHKTIMLTMPITEEAITSLYFNLNPCPASLKIADLGCSSGPNTLLVVSQLIKKICKIRRKTNKISSPEIQIYLNDLPGNDFNSVFKSLSSFNEGMRNEVGSDLFGNCFFNGVPGSFYDRLFPINSLHFVHSSYSLMWLSQVPDGIEGNKGNICCSRRSPKCVVKAYFKQFQKDFSVFLKCRSVELVAGGYMVLTIFGRKIVDPSCLIWELLGNTLQDMVSEGLIKEEKLHSFNVPLYTPSLDELNPW
ncbi:hypothetical protein Leryth_002698 [Lithospermum erythrorhizon]|nr:hypothetical protein Leryth_002698 [Lithospermum erythrorhizon]